MNQEMNKHICLSLSLDSDIIYSTSDTTLSPRSPPLSPSFSPSDTTLSPRSPPLSPSFSPSDTTLSPQSPPLSPSFSKSTESRSSTRNEYRECGRQGHPTETCGCPRAYRLTPSDSQRAKWKRKAKYLRHCREKRKRQRERDMQETKHNNGSFKRLISASTATI
eukprot:49901_1